MKIKVHLLSTILLVLAAFAAAVMAEDPAPAEQPADSGAITQIKALQKEVAALESTVAGSDLLKGDLADPQNHTECSFETGLCNPANISVNGDTKSLVALSRVPAEACLVTVTANESFLGKNADLGFDCLARPFGETVDVSLHLKTMLFPSFGGVKGNSTSAHARLRPQSMTEKPQSMTERCDPRAAPYAPWPPRDGMSVLLHSSMRSVIVTAYGLNEAKTACNQALKSARVKIDYPRWEVGAGAFYAFSYLGDETLVQQKAEQPADAAAGAKDHFTIVRRDKQSLQTATGISFNVYPANYPSLGLMFGYTDRGDQSPTYYLGGGLRLRSLGRHAVISFMGGCATGQVKTFPGIAKGDVIDEGDIRLEGRSTYQIKPFLSVHIGFAFGATRSGAS